VCVCVCVCIHICYIKNLCYRHFVISSTEQNHKIVDIAQNRTMKS